MKSDLVGIIMNCHNIGKLNYLFLNFLCQNLLKKEYLFTVK